MSAPRTPMSVDELEQYAHDLCEQAGMDYESTVGDIIQGMRESDQKAESMKKEVDDSYETDQYDWNLEN